MLSLFRHQVRGSFESFWRRIKESEHLPLPLLRRCPNGLERFEIESYSRSDRKCLFWWERPCGSPNIGDHLSLVIVRETLALQGRRLKEWKPCGSRLLGIGSSMHFAQTNDCIWGTGVNGNVPDEGMAFEDLDVRAVRGPLTRERLLGRGIDCPEIYGDPALLTPQFLPEASLMGDREHDRTDCIVVPHYLDDAGTYAGFEEYVCSPRQFPTTFLRRLLEGRKIVSSSLHGLVLAEAYGRPAVFYDVGAGRSRLKYDDYYRGTGRPRYPAASSIEEAMTMEAPPPPDLGSISTGLLRAFPYDLFADRE